MKDGLLVINSDIVIWQIHCGILQYISDSLYRMVSLWHNIDIVNDMVCYSIGVPALQAKNYPLS